MCLESPVFSWAKASNKFLGGIFSIIWLFTFIVIFIFYNLEELKRKHPMDNNIIKIDEEELKKVFEEKVVDIFSPSCYENTTA